MGSLKKRKQRKLRKERYFARLKNTLGPESDKLRKKHRRKVRASKKKYRLKIIENDPIKKLRRIGKLIDGIQWDSCVQELKIDELGEILTLRPASYLKNKTQRKFLQEYIDLYSDEIFFGTFFEDSCYDTVKNEIISEIFNQEKFLSLSEKIKINNKIIQIPTSKCVKVPNAQPRDFAAELLLYNNQIILYRDQKLYVTERLKNDETNTMKNIVFINQNLKSAFWDSNQELMKYPIAWLVLYFKNLELDISYQGYEMKFWLNTFTAPRVASKCPYVNSDIPLKILELY